ncbi:hypothetical protein [Aureivirga sp. CE67]|uniref:hypothetical protein n=1 Tax=Aureivirga sp. CE67 TaxID=1788983 RepID=UPI0018CB29F5|nr:hypothetical protein [Aureivirga sp. CE67]
MKTQKLITLLILLFFSFSTIAQVSVARNHLKKPKKVKTKAFEKFKKSTTIFVLSNLHSKEEYEKILNEVWTVTPFKVVNEADYNYKDYYFGDYSIFGLATRSYRYRGKYGGLHVFNQSYLKLYVFNTKSSLKEIANDNKTEEEFLKNLKKVKTHEIGLILLNSAGEFKEQIYNGLTREDIRQIIFNDSFSTNNTLGYFRNNLQKINTLLLEEQNHYLLDSDSNPEELMKLSSDTLYIPEFIKNYYRSSIYRLPKDDSLLKVITDDFEENYDFNFKIVTKEIIDQKILNKEPIYYLRFVSTNGNLFTHIVNAQTGEPIYRQYKKLSFILRKKNIKKINKAIEKSVKKIMKDKQKAKEKAEAAKVLNI